MTNNDELVDFMGARGGNDAFGEYVDRPIKAARRAASELAHVRAADGNLQYEPAIGERAQRGEKRKADCNRNYGRGKSRSPGKIGREHRRDDAAGRGSRDPQNQHGLHINQKNSKPPRRLEDAPQRAAQKIVEPPPGGADKLQSERLRHRAPDEVFKP
jgi:hypothetical protein